MLFNSQGSIKVRTSDVSARVNISVNISAESEEDIETIMVDFNEDSANGKSSLLCDLQMLQVPQLMILIPVVVQRLLQLPQSC